MIQNRLIEEAIQIYRLALKNISSNNSSILLDLANLHNSRLEYKEATQAYIDYLRKNPEQFSYIQKQLSQLADHIEEAEQRVNNHKKR